MSLKPLLAIGGLVCVMGIASWIAQRFKKQQVKAIGEHATFVTIRSSILVDQNQFCNRKSCTFLIQKGQQYELSQINSIQACTHLPMQVSNLIAQYLPQLCPHVTESRYGSRSLFCRPGCDTLWIYTGPNSELVTERIRYYMREYGCDKLVLFPQEFKDFFVS
jgi:hypothetical protein